MQYHLNSLNQTLFTSHKERTVTEINQIVLSHGAAISGDSIEE